MEKYLIYYYYNFFNFEIIFYIKILTIIIYSLILLKKQNKILILYINLFYKFILLKN